MLVKWIRSFKILSQIKSFWVALKEKFLLWLSPVPSYEQELNSLVRPRDEVKQLYKTLTEGKSASDLLGTLISVAESEVDRDRVQCGEANLILSILYQDDIETCDFFLQKDFDKVSIYREKAESCLGINSTLSLSAQKILDCIRLGGEPQYAYQKLKSHANSDQDIPLRSWSSKVLSFLYHKGFRGNNISICPNQELSKKYHSQAKSYLEFFEGRLNYITRKLANVKLLRSKAFLLIKKIAGYGNKVANHHYAQHLEAQNALPENFIYYYYQASQKNKDAPFMFKTKGHRAANSRLIKILETNSYDLKDEIALKQFRLQDALDIESSTHSLSLNRILSDAKEGDLISILQSGMYFIKQVSVQGDAITKAEEYFVFAKDKIKRTLSPFENKLYEKLCTKIAHYYEELFLSSAASLPSELSEDDDSLTSNLDEDTKECIEKIIFYLQQIPPTSKVYAEVQFKIAHYQRYGLKQISQTIDTFSRLSQQGDVDCSSRVVILGFKKFWDDFQSNLNADDKQVLVTYEKKNKSFFHHIPKYSTQEKIIPEENAVLLMKQVIDLLDQFNRTREKKDFIPYLTEMQNNIKKLEEKMPQVACVTQADTLPESFDFIGKFDLALKKKFEDIWSAVSPKSTYFFSSKPPESAFFKAYKKLLQEHLSFVSVIKCPSSTEELDYSKSIEKSYFHLIEKAYLHYLANICRKFLIIELGEEETKRQQITNDTGALVYGK